MIHKSWETILDFSLSALEKDYRLFLEKDEGYFPKKSEFLNAFKTLSLKDTKAILFGQDPYPRFESAIGYAFIDAKVKEIFSKKGFSKEVNKATSLRNFLKMQLVAEGFLKSNHTSQDDISKLPKKNLINSIYDLKDNFEKQGILLLNTALIFTKKEDSQKHIRKFMPFMKTLLSNLEGNMDLILFGNLAKNIEKILPKNHNFNLIKTLHPYNVAFISDENTLKYFSKFDLLKIKKCS